MKITYIANLRLPTEKAYGVQIAKTCEAMANLGHEVLLVCPSRINKIKKDFFDYYGVKRNFGFNIIPTRDFYWPGILDKAAFVIKNYLSSKALVREALKQSADIYYTRDEQVSYVLNKKDKNIVFECHKFSNKKKHFYRHFKKIVAISEGLKSDLIEAGVKKENILVAHDGVDLEKFDLEISKNEAREKLSLPLDKKLIMYTGHLFEWKGAGTLLEASKNFELEAGFVFVGGTEQDIKEFKNKAEGLENVLILGHKPYEEIPVYLKAADILVLPNASKEDISSKYTSPLKLFEYMASGRPIVASDLPSLREILTESNCFFFKPDNSDDLARVINEVLNSKTMAEQISAKAIEDVKNYTWQKRAEKILNFV